MAFGKKCESNVKRGNEDYGVGLVRSSPFGRKRIALSNVCMEFEDVNDEDICVNPTKPSKRQCFQDSFFCAEKSVFEDLPQEILSLVAKHTHFAYSTPRKTAKFSDSGDFNEVETPDAPKQSRVSRSRLSKKKLTDISVNLFASDKEDVWPRTYLFWKSKQGFE